MWLKSLAMHNCRSVSVIPTLRGVPLYGTDMAYIFSHEVMILRVQNNLAKRTSRFLKRTFDIFGALSIILMLLPALLVLGFLVGRDGGPPIYGHERVGLNGRKFKCLKFRSMVINSKEVLEKSCEPIRLPVLNGIKILNSKTIPVLLKSVTLFVKPALMSCRSCGTSYAAT